MPSRRASNLLALALGTVVGLAVAEVGVRLALPHMAYGYPKRMFLPDPDVGFKFKPNLDAGFLTKQEFSTRVWTNSKGFRDREREYEKPVGSFRILSLGDSFTWGAYGVEADETFSAVLERFLATRFPARSFEVINTAVFGYGTDNELRFFTSEGRRYGADVVLVNLFIGNDFFDNLEWGELSVVDGDLAWTKNVPVTRLSLKSLRGFLLTYSHLASAVERTLFKVPVVQRIVRRLTLGGESQHVFEEQEMQALIGPGNSARYREIFAATAGLLEKFQEEVEAEEAELVVVVIPAVYQLHPDVKEQMFQRFGADQETLVKAQRDLRGLGESSGFLVVDLLPVFEEEYEKGNRLYWQFNPHFNHYGNEVTARVIMEQLLEHGLVEQASPQK